jgi:hypothetical protein
MINFVFEDTHLLTNYINCPDINNSGIPRFSTSPSVGKLINKGMVNVFDKKEMPDQFIIPTGVNHSPNDWTGSRFAYKNTRLGCFSYIEKEYLEAVRNGNAMLLFDQTLEGYQTPWLWDYFHEECKQFDIDPRSIIYITGNLLAEHQYLEWSENLDKKINIISHPLFENDVYYISKDLGISETFEDYYLYKKDNLSKIKTFNCLQKRLRSHRTWIYQSLFDADLLNSGICSMNPFSQNITFFEGRFLTEDQVSRSNQILPLLVNGKSNTEFDDNYYITRITRDVYLDSWVSVISEASFGDSDGTVFLSEKIFKPISCLHPFIVAGNRHSLLKLKQMGYKTFDGFIDESYDDLPTFERLTAIVEAVKKINQIDDKLSWYKLMEDILLHNYRTLKKNSEDMSVLFNQIKNCYDRYFSNR